MSKDNLKDQLQSYESYINDIPNVIDPCKMCKNKKEEYEDVCVDCCWYYPSKFEVAFESENKKMSELLIAQANGKTIQTKMMNGEWRDVLITEQDKKCDASFYRIKPEEERNCKNCGKTSCKNYNCDLPFTCGSYREKQ